MRFKFRPSDDSFYEFFNAAAANLVKGTELLTELAVPGADIQSVAERLGDVEHDSDRITHEVYNKINSTFITPFDREDIYRLASNLDDVMDHIEAAGSLVYLYGLTKLPVLPREMHDLVDVIDRQSRLTADAMPRLKTMKDLKEYWVECNRLENEGDQAYRMLLVRLFSGEYDTLTVLKMKEVADELEKACDALEHVANTVEQISVKDS
jgi:predicted phosphate transport protein (TIGR00153 family)